MRPREAVMFAQSLGLSRVIFEGDCLQVILAIAPTYEDHSYLENISLLLLLITGLDVSPATCGDLSYMKSPGPRFIVPLYVRSR
ncbi:unnamed protein product [Prunus brigantina]